MKIRHPFQYEFEISPGYTEYGVDKGAHFEDANVENADVVNVFNSTKDLTIEEILEWLQKNRGSFNSSTLLIDTDDGNQLLKYKDSKIEFCIQELALNKIRHLNTLLNRASEILPKGGYFWCHSKTARLKKEIILKKYIRGLNYIIYLLHYVWHRIIPKLSLTKKIYFGITKGKNRTYHRVEVLGRMYRAGFEVVDEGFRQGEFFVLSRKQKDPIWDDEPTGSPLIKLRRVGKNGNIIGVYKFRTMYSYSEYLQPYIYEHNALREGGKFDDDYRINTWGKLMRKFWLDELPMLINMFKGEMKIVGVRPLSKHYFSLYTKEMQDLRIKVKPGLFPPFYYDKKTPETLEDVQESEKRYIESYLKKPFKTDLKYFWGTVWNIVVRCKRSK